MSADVYAPGSADEVRSAAATAKQGLLADRVQRIRTRAASGSLDRWLLIIGGILLPLGFLLIVLGWLGASQTVLLFEQIPYMVSGGFLGLAFVFAGGFVYFAYWQTVLVRDTRAERRQLTDTLERIETLLAGGSVAAGNGTARSGGITVGRLVATETGSMVHRADCPVVLNRDNLRTVSPDEAELQPCRICNPYDDA